MSAEPAADPIRILLADDEIRGAMAAPGGCNACLPFGQGHLTKWNAHLTFVP